MMSAISFPFFSFRYSLNNHIVSVADAVLFVSHENCIHIRFGHSIQLAKNRMHGNRRCLNKIFVEMKHLSQISCFGAKSCFTFPSLEIGDSAVQQSSSSITREQKTMAIFVICKIQCSNSDYAAEYSRFCLVIAVPIPIINRHFIHQNTQERVQKRTNKRSSQQLHAHEIKMHRTKQRTYIRRSYEGKTKY